jgi:hypothetical protein
MSGYRRVEKSLSGIWGPTGIFPQTLFFKPERSISVNPWRLERSRWRGGRLRRDRMGKKVLIG